MAGEATCSLSCIQITLILFVGALVFRLWHGGWWVDSATTIALGLLFARESYKMLSWVSSAEFDGGCCADCKQPSETSSIPRWAAKFPGIVARIQKSTRRANADTDSKLELGEAYRDLCSCCLEKDACRESDMCKCDGKSVVTMSVGILSGSSFHTLPI